MKSTGVCGQDLPCLRYSDPFDACYPALKRGAITCRACGARAIELRAVTSPSELGVPFVLTLLAATLCG
jgi:hypothetical protein